MADQTHSLSRFVHWGRKVVAVGRNYRDLCAERGVALPTKPVLFVKLPSCYLEEGKGPILIPRGCKDLRHEVELAVVIGKTCRDVPEGEVVSKVAGYALILDMTAWDFIDEAKAKGNPWAMAKCFDTALPVSRFIPKEDLQDPGNVRIWCKVNGKARQDGNTSDMVFPIPTLIAYITRYFTLHPGDVVLTGTPAGIGPVSPGDTLTAGLGDYLTMEFSVAQRE